MSQQNSILDKIIESQEMEQAAKFNPDELVSNLIKNLSHKESDILSRRFGLSGKGKETLEQIGKYYDITRERIRQIEKSTIKKIKELKDFKQQIESAEQHITHLLENYGGIMEENFLLDHISLSQEEKEKQSSRFILNYLLNDKIEPIKGNDEFLTGWKLPVVSLDIIKQAINELVAIIEEREKLIGAQELLSNFKGKEFYKNNKAQIINLKLGVDEEKLEQEIDKIVDSYLKISKKVDQNILSEWGLSNWNTISPKRMSDKVYLILRQAERPLHFTEITDLINKANFDRKVAYPATIHNELILDDRYVLVGRGIYALKEWGYKSGTVIDIIIDILKKAGRPLSKEDIVKAILDQRMVKKSTIYLALTNKDKIKKLPDGKYILNQ